MIEFKYTNLKRHLFINEFIQALVLHVALSSNSTQTNFILGKKMIILIIISSMIILVTIFIIMTSLSSFPSLQLFQFFRSSIDHFSLYVLFSHFRPRDATRGNSCFQMSSYARANVRITNDKNKRKIPMRTSRGLKWANNTYKI